MVLAVAGKCTVDEVLEVADRLLKPCEDQKLETVFPEETLDIVREETVESAAVGQPLFNLGIKCQPRQGLDNLRAEMLADITMQTLSGSSSPLYQEMLQSGLVNESFSSEVFNGDGFFTMIFGGESRDPQAVREKVTAAILDAQKNGLDEVMFNESKKSAYENWCGSWAMFRRHQHAGSSSHGWLRTVRPMQVLSEMTLDDCNRFLGKKSMSAA
ncbi:MAG: insulinase family protein [Ruminococcus callidus]